jgi:hypothetical protein
LELQYLLDVQVNGIVPTRMRHVIKRYLKRIGFRSLKVEHVQGDGPFVLRLVARGKAVSATTSDQEAKLSYLSLCVLKALENPRGLPIHASQADPEVLRELLAKEEPSLLKIYYAPNPAAPKRT